MPNISTTSPIEPPRFLLQRNRTGNRSAAKLTKYDVEEIRRYVRAEGFGLPRATQVQALGVQFPDLNPRSIEQVITNGTWFDPKYDPTLPLVHAQPHVGTFIASLPFVWLAIFLMLFKTPAPARRALPAPGTL